MNTWTLVQQIRIDSIGEILSVLSNALGDDTVVRGSVATAFWTQVPRCPNDLDIFCFSDAYAVIDAINSSRILKVVDYRPIRSSSKSLPVGATKLVVDVGDQAATQDSIICDITPITKLSLSCSVATDAHLGSRVPFTVRSIDPEGILSEKIIAYIDDATRVISLRWNDLYDIAALALSSRFDRETVRNAVCRLGQAREMQLPSSLPSPHAWWTGPWSKTLWPIHKFNEIDFTFGEVEKFVETLLTPDLPPATWNQNQWRWEEK